MANVPFIMLPPRDGSRAGLLLADSQQLSASPEHQLLGGAHSGRFSHPAEEARSLMYATTCSFCQHIISALSTNYVLRKNKEEAAEYGQKDEGGQKNCQE